MTALHRRDPRAQLCAFCGKLIGDADWAPDGVEEIEDESLPIVHYDCAWPDPEDGRIPDE